MTSEGNVSVHVVQTMAAGMLGGMELGGRGSVAWECEHDMPGWEGGGRINGRPRE